MPIASRALSDADARRLAEQCFTPPATDERAPCELLGIEFEWLTIAAHRPESRLDLDELMEVATGPGPLPAGGSVTFEPGGQIELDTPPVDGIDAACRAARTDQQELARRLGGVGVGLVSVGLDAVRPPERVLHSDRYDAMEAVFDAAGPHGKRMMCNTAALQVNIDLGPEPVAHRWRLANALGPTLVACFANSPFGEQSGTGRPIGWLANRIATWWGIDPSRTAPPDLTGDPVSAWLRYALDAKVLLMHTAQGAVPQVRDAPTFGQWMAEGHELGWPTEEDFAYHLTTLFPPVRPRGWLELRMLDALDDEVWPVAIAVLVALLTDPDAAAALEEATAATSDLWLEAARHGLGHPALATSADRCFAAALDALPRLGVDRRVHDAVGAYGDRYVANRRCPADDLLDEYHRSGSMLPSGTSVVTA